MSIFYSRKCVMLSWALTIIPVIIYAQEKTYTLNDLLISAKNHLPSLLEKRALINEATAGVTEAKDERIPLLKFNQQFTASTSNGVEGAYFPMGTAPSVSGGIRENQDNTLATGNLGALYSEYELFNFGLHKARVESARSTLALSESDYNRSFYTVAFNLSQLYFRTLQYQYRRLVDSLNVNRYEDIYKIIQSLTKSGLRPGADSSQALAELAKAKVTYNQVSATLGQLKEQLRAYTGIPSNELALDTAAISLSTTINTDEALKKPAENPFLDYYQRERDVLLLKQKLISKTYLPKLVLVGAVWGRGSSLSWNNRFQQAETGLSWQRYNYAGGLALVYNFTDIIHRKDQLAMNRFRIEASDHAIDQMKLDLQSDVNQAAISLNSVRNNLLQLAIQRKSAEDVFAQKTAQYKAGLVNLIDLTNAGFVLYRSQTDYIQAISDWYMAGLDQAAAAGNLEAFIQSIQ